jgi:hypothetical protein
MTRKTSSLPAEIDALLTRQPGSFQEAVDRSFSAFWDEAKMESGECTDAFNKLLGSGSFALNQPLRLAASVPEAKVAAAVLAKIYAIETPDCANNQSRLSGWDGLNKDAKIWCKAVLTALPVVGATAEQVHDLLVAKTFVGLLIADGIPESERHLVLPNPPWTKDGLGPNYDS